MILLALFLYSFCAALIIVCCTRTLRGISVAADEFQAIFEVFVMGGVGALRVEVWYVLEDVPGGESSVSLISWCKALR